MHEYGIVESMIEEVSQILVQKGVEEDQVIAVRFQRGSTLSEDALVQAFQVLSPGTLFENAELIIDTVSVKFECPCGYQQTITNDDLAGHMFVCPSCGAVREINEAHDLTLTEVTLNPTADPEVKGKRATTIVPERTLSSHILQPPTNHTGKVS